MNNAVCFAKVVNVGCGGGGGGGGGGGWSLLLGWRWDILELMMMEGWKMGIGMFGGMRMGLLDGLRGRRGGGGNLVVTLGEGGTRVEVCDWLG